jgi:hypothetical protein
MVFGFAWGERWLHRMLYLIMIGDASDLVLEIVNLP